MIDIIDNTVAKFNMLSVGDKVLVGVSGGADSMLLLHYLICVKEKYSLTIEVAHIEHGIRGEESIADAEFVKAFCEKNNLKLWYKSINATEGAKENGMSVEEYSRNERYGFFNSIECDKIATAHNLSDNVETVLFRLSRGTGLNGMCGIPPVRGKIIRPLIDLKGNAIRTYCDSNNITYRIDSTNLDNDYSRNYVRNVIVKDFEKLNFSFEDSVNSFVNDCNEDYLFIENASQKAFDDCFINDSLDTNKLADYDTALVKRVLIKYFSKYEISLSRIQLSSIMSLIEKSGRIQLSGDKYAVCAGGFLRFAIINNNSFNYKISTEILRNFEFNSKAVDFYCDYDKIVGSVKFRFRQPGDTISPANRNCTKTLKKLYNELSIPIEAREHTIVAVDDLGIIGIVGYCVDERVKADKSTEKIYTVKISLED